MHTDIQDVKGFCGWFLSVCFKLFIWESLRAVTIALIPVLGQNELFLFIVSAMVIFFTRSSFTTVFKITRKAIKR